MGFVILETATSERWRNSRRLAGLLPYCPEQSQHITAPRPGNRTPRRVATLFPAPSSSINMFSAGAGDSYAVLSRPRRRRRRGPFRPACAAAAAAAAAGGTGGDGVARSANRLVIHFSTAAAHHNTRRPFPLWSSTSPSFFTLHAHTYDPRFTSKQKARERGWRLEGGLGREALRRNPG